MSKESGEARSAKSKQRLERQAVLTSILERIHAAESFSAVLPEIERDMLGILGGVRMTIYQRQRNRSAIVSKFLSGRELRTIVVPLSNSSIAGHVALSGKSLCIEDVRDAEALAKIHPDLRFDDSFDRQSGFTTKSVMSVPILHGNVLLGVLQVLNRIDGTVFLRTDLRNAQNMAVLIGQKFRYDLQTTSAPFEHLVLRKLISAEELEQLEARARAEKVNVPRLLIAEANLTAEEIGRSLEHYYQVPYFPYEPDREIPRQLVADIKDAFLKRQMWVPVDGDRDEVTILIDDPSDTERIREMQSLLRADRYVIGVGLPDDILRYLGEDLGADDAEADLSGLLDELEEEAPESREDGSDDGVNENEGTIIRLVRQLIVEAYQQGASDIHIEPNKGNQAADVRYRVDGVCRKALTIPASHVRAVVARIKVISALDISERRKPQDGKCTVRYQRKPVELRVATLPTVHGESAVLRILAASKPLPLDAMNFSEGNRDRVDELAQHPHGILLVVGPTGSGKTTTLHSILGHINRPDRKIWTAEDPVEITQPGLQQVQVQPKIGFDFAAALRAFLRADPDVIMIGEMRDRETAHAGVEASLTGHLVLSTLHTNSAPETVTRLLDLGLDPVSFADALLGVLAQRLMRTLCPDCKATYTPSSDEVRLLIRLYGKQYFPELGVDPRALELQRAVGCSKCAKSGYRGRTGIHELLGNGEIMREKICNHATVAEIRDQAMADGMRTLMQDGIAKVIQGQSDIDQLKRVAAG
jgi:type II secretory ATPase GspE/PulE/Tfp pilus assembly ATPase PilB-like protein